MKTRNVLIALLAVGLFSVSAYADTICDVTCKDGTTTQVEAPDAALCHDECDLFCGTNAEVYACVFKGEIIKANPSPSPYCEDAPLVGVPSNTPGDTNPASGAGGGQAGLVKCLTEYGAPGGWAVGGQWVQVVGTGNTMTASLCTKEKANVDAAMVVICNSCKHPVCVGASEDLCGSLGYSPEVTWCSEAGETYWVGAGDNYAPQDLINIDITDGEPCSDAMSCTGGAGLTCEDALAPSNTPVDTCVGGPANPRGSCWSGDPDQPALWYKFDNPADQQVRITTSHSAEAYDSSFAVYSACPEGGKPLITDEVGCSEDEATKGVSPYNGDICLDLLAGQYWVQVSDWGGSCGPYQLDIVMGKHNEKIGQYCGDGVVNSPCEECEVNTDCGLGYACDEECKCYSAIPMLPPWGLVGLGLLLLAGGATVFGRRRK